MKYSFSKVYEFEGKEYKELEFDLDAIRGADISAAKKEFAASGNFSPLPTTDSDFCAILLARLIKQPREFFDGLPARDYCALTQRVSNFLMG